MIYSQNLERVHPRSFCLHVDFRMITNKFRGDPNLFVGLFDDICLFVLLAFFLLFLIKCSGFGTSVRLTYYGRSNNIHEESNNKLSGEHRK